ALAAARALYDVLDDPEVIARRAMAIAADLCIYTNNNLTVESI
ncbi:MAG TPA: HslU--HslV peptidase proteolytic subunit, partial [Hyphomonadaceae bacterium]|nr:HslU--HslV peptidase proteolytic subunit [Hyphomonadaceae bacterium]